jgi:DNA-directed RNA polymerase specialized sigma24 family protein
VSISVILAARSDRRVPTSRKSQWNLSQEAFDALLACLDSDREQAGSEYEQLRKKLLKFFGWRGCPSPEDYADETFNRVARRIQEGVKIKSLQSYLLGTARFVLQESFRGPEQGHINLEQISSPANRETADRNDSETRLGCLEKCLGELPEESRQLISNYYEEYNSKKMQRQHLAKQMGIPMNALRIRVHRIRIRLEHCVEICAKQ